MILATPGYGISPAPVDLRVDAMIISRIGHAHRDLAAGEVIEIRWGLEQAASIGWGEIAVLAGTPTLGNAMARVVGSVDMTAPWSSYGAGFHNAAVELAEPIAVGQSILLAFAQWCAPIATSSGSSYPSPVTVRLVGSACADPLCAGLVGSNRAGLKPSAHLGLDLSINAYDGTHPIAAVASIPW